MIFVTGGTGLIGSFLLAHFLKTGQAVKALYREQIPAGFAGTAGIEWIKGDILDSDLMRDLIGQSHQVYHCAGLVSYAAQDAGLLKEINVQGTANVVDACLENPRVRLCHVSSIAAIGSDKGQQILRETNKWDPAVEHSLYASSKYFGELEVWRGIAEGLQAVIVNPSVVLGPATDWSRSSTQLFKYVANEKKFYTRGSGNFVDVRDVVTCMTTLLEREEALGERFILNAGALPYQEFFGLVARGLGKKAPGILVPESLLGLVWRLERVRSFLTGKRPLITKETAKVTQRPHIYASNKVQNQVAHVFLPLNETIAWCCQEIMKQPAYS